MTCVISRAAKPRCLLVQLAVGEGSSQFAQRDTVRGQSRLVDDQIVNALAAVVGCSRPAASVDRGQVARRQQRDALDGQLPVLDDGAEHGEIAADERADRSGAVDVAVVVDVTVEAGAAGDQADQEVKLAGAVMQVFQLEAGSSRGAGTVELEVEDRLE